MRRRPRSIQALIALAALVFGACAQLSALPDLEQDDLKARLAQSSKIFASDGRLITTLHGEENRTIVRALDTIPDHVRDAVLAIEDERFYEHDGVDLRAVVRAAVANVTSRSIKEGGSTITQQYVKNVIISPGETAERTFERKINEAALARQIEGMLTKDQILLRYLNTVYFGNGAYGIQAAAKTYFDKPARKLTLAEGALIAGLIRAPQTYNPFEDKQAARDRRDLVLSKMGQLGWVPPADVAAAREQGLRLDRGVAMGRYPAPYFLDYVQRTIKHDPYDVFGKVGKTPTQREQALFTAGLKIHTTIDLDMQAAAEQSVRRALPQPSDPHASLVAIDPNTGYVRAMVGGRDWFARKRKDRFAKLNLAIQAEPGLGSPEDGNQAAGTGRQAGSAFKPFALAAAIKEGVPLSKSYRASSCMAFARANNGEDWRVCNYESADYGSRLSLLEATVKSVNVVYAQLILEIGAADVVDLAGEMGINTPLDPVPSAALGTNPVNPLGMASAYGTLATNGLYHPPIAITRIVSARGKVLYRSPRAQGERVLDPATSYLTTSALEQVIQRGTGVRAQIGRPAAGKTGTAQEYRDAWFVGYTPDLVASVWVGYPQGEIEMKSYCGSMSSLPTGAPSCIATRVPSTGVTGGSWPAEIWAAFMKAALAGIPPSDFVVPDIELKRVAIDARTGCLADRFTPDDDREVVLIPEDQVPNKTCRVKDKMVKVPDVFGFPAKDAVRLLLGEGFDVEIVRQFSRDYPPGRVIGQDPSADRKARIGSTITLAVSTTDREGRGGDRGGGGSGVGGGGGRSGGGGSNQPDTTTVPDVLGMTAEDATRVLNSHGFDADIIYERESGGRAKNRRERVWKQSPAGGTQARRGSTVRIWANPS